MNRTDRTPTKKSSILYLGIDGLLILGFAGVLALIAQSFVYGQPEGRPITILVGVSWLASAVALRFLFSGLRIKQPPKSLLGIIILYAIAARMILVFSNPILEIDYYRYLWDGMTANQGVAPFKFSPEAVLRSTADLPELRKLQEFVNENRPEPNKNSPALDIVSRVHYEKFATLYPPVSQFVFRTTTWLIPDDASVQTHIVGLKFALVLFDIGVVLTLAWLLTVLGKHPAWLMAYAWNPLVLKEIANGGHLDSIAIFFMTAGIAVFLWISKAYFQANTSGELTSGELIDSDPAPFAVKSTMAGSFLSGALMGLGLGAKLFPVIFMPAMFVFLLTKKGLRKHALIFAAACLLVSYAAMWPMINPDNKAVAVKVDEKAPDSTDGLAAFMTQWRMNDVIFSGVYQNVEHHWNPAPPAPPNPKPWYVFVSNETRTKWIKDFGKVKLHVVPDFYVVESNDSDPVKATEGEVAFTLIKSAKENPLKWAENFENIKLYPGEPDFYVVEFGEGAPVAVFDGDMAFSFITSAKEDPSQWLEDLNEVSLQVDKDYYEFENKKGELSKVYEGGLTFSVIKSAKENLAFFVARLFTVALFGLFYLWILYKLWRTRSTDDLANLMFLIVGIFFYLQPTQNPWYWVWAMPLVCFAKNKGWLFVSMILFVYYLRFWFREMSNSAETVSDVTYEFMGETYVGVDFFDHCLTWVELAVVSTILIVSLVVQKVMDRKEETSLDQAV